GLTRVRPLRKASLRALSGRRLALRGLTRVRPRSGGGRVSTRMLLFNRFGMETAEVARRARTENFPIASLLFPRPLRPHLRAVYGFCRLVDILGDEAEGDRLALLDECERQLDEPEWPGMVALAPTIHAFDLPREPFVRLIEANRIDQPVSSYEPWEDVK